MTGLSAPEQASATVDAVVENAERLGLTWGLRPATVTSTSPPEAVLDGDTVAIGVISMIVGAVSIGQRVYVMYVPPSGNYVVGTISPAGEFDSDALNTTSAVFSTSSASFVNMALVVPTLPFTKRAASTRLALHMHATGYLTGPAGAVVDTGLLIDADYAIGSLVYNNINTHLQTSGVLYVPAGVPAGDYTVIPRVRVSGGSTFNMDGGDRVSFEVIEKA